MTADVIDPERIAIVTDQTVDNLIKERVAGAGNALSHTWLRLELGRIADTHDITILDHWSISRDSGAIKSIYQIDVVFNGQTDTHNTHSP